MSTFQVTIHVGDLQGQYYEPLEALVDTGSSHLAVPGPVLERLGIAVEERLPFELADNRMVDYGIGQVRVRIDDRERFTTVVFSDPDTDPLLGSSTLELFNLGVDPVGQRLTPVNGLMK